MIGCNNLQQAGPVNGAPVQQFHGQLNCPLATYSNYSQVKLGTPGVDVLRAYRV